MSPNVPQRLNYGMVLQKTRSQEDRVILQKAWENYVHAKVMFDTLSSDTNMIELIGTYSRYSRVLRELEDKYGRF